MDTSTTQAELLAFFKALADVDRLKIAGLLAQEPLTTEQIAGRLALPPATVSRHLARLEAVRLVAAGEGNDAARYRFEAGVLEDTARRVLAQQTPLPGEEDWDTADRKVLAAYLGPDGRLTSIPTQQKKRLVVLRHLAGLFEPGEQYPEKRVNEILRRFDDDTATLRRLLVDYRFLARERGEYWRVEQA